MVTPFRDDGEIDIDGAVRLARWLIDHGNDALVLSGTTGEAPTLSDSEKVALWKAVKQAVNVPVVAGTGTADTAHSVKLTQAAVAAGVDGILAVTPYYNRPSQAGIASHVRAMAAAAAGVPVLLYDIPVRTGRKVATRTIWELAEEGSIVGVKDATGDPAGAAELVVGAPEGFELYSGNDGDTLPLLAVGAVGVISVESHWAGQTMGAMIQAFQKGDLEAARALNARLLPSHRFQSSEEAPNPVPTKVVLAALGLPAGPCRPPMGPFPVGLDAAAQEILAGLAAKDA
jgi:4-hydroxy-tetrahydrodipicolinate synthase